MSTLSSGILRSRFHIILGSGLEAPGFVFDKARMPGTEIDMGTAVGVGSYRDGSNAAFEDQFHIPEVSGILQFKCNRANMTPGQPFLIAGHGDNDDLEFSGIDAGDTQWTPVIDTGIFFDLDEPCYLYSQRAIEDLVTNDATFIPIVYPVSHYKPISLASFYVDEWGRARAFETFRQKHSFTSINDSETLVPISGIYEPLYDQVIWGNVDTSGFECFIDASQSGIVCNRFITSGVYAYPLRRVPWSQEYIQLPIVPVISIDAPFWLNVQSDPVFVTSGVGGVLTLSGLNPQDPWVTLRTYVRVSGSWDEISGILPVEGSTVEFQANGMLLIDDDDFRQEIVTYTGVSSSGFTGISRGAWGTSPSIHRDGAQVRQFFDSAIVSGVILVATSGDCLVDYWCQIYSGNFTLNQRTGLLHIPCLSGIHRAVVEINYSRGLLLCYEPSGFSEYLCRPSGIDLNPLTHGTDQGLLWTSMFPLRPARIVLDTSRSKNDDGTVGPIYAGNDFLVVNALVVTHSNAPVPQEDVTLVLENPVNIGLVNTEDPSEQLISRTTDGTGTARFVYTPPDTIHGLGYFIPSGNLLGSGLTLVTPVPIEEVWNENGYKSLLFSIENDDVYTPYSEVSGFFAADGRFELVTVISGTGDSGYTIWKAVEPVALLDSDGLVVVASGSRVAQIVYPNGSIPSSTTIGSYFVSVQRRISVGAYIQSSNVASESLEVVVGIPRFMTGEFIFGPIDDPDTSAFDSLAYLTINPFDHRKPTDSRLDARSLGHTFRVQGSYSSRLRSKFYVAIDPGVLQSTPAGQIEMKKLYASRHRFILEV